MNQSTSVTIRSLLPETFEQMNPLLKDEFRKYPGIGLAKIAWDIVGAQANKALDNILDFDVFKALAQAWAKVHELQEYADPEKHPQPEWATVHLGKHNFTQKIHPKLDVRVEPFERFSLMFTVELAADIRAIALSIYNAHITGGSTGDIVVSAQLKYGDIKLHDPKRTREFKLPGTFELDSPGLKIEPRQVPS